MSDKRKQAADQCRAVAYMARCIAEIHDDYEDMLRAGGAEQILEQVGARTARWMERLGDMLNGIDAGKKEDAWMAPVFEEAHRLWPQSTIPAIEEAIRRALVAWRTNPANTQRTEAGRVAQKPQTK